MALTETGTFLDTGRGLFSAEFGAVADTSPAAVEFGRREIALAHHEMPGLMALRERGGAPLAGARVAGSLHMTIQTAVLIETLAELGADLRWASCNVFSTQDHAAAAVLAGPPEAGGDGDSPVGVPVFAWKGESLAEYWWCLLQALVWPDGSGPTLIVDDGGDATLLIHLGVEYEEAGAIPDPAGFTGEERVLHELLSAVRDARGDRFWRDLAAGVRGVSEETTTGVRRLIQREADGSLLFPAINVNDAVTKSKFDNLYGCRHSLVDAVMRATDLMLSGKRVHVCGYGDVGKGSVQAMLGQKARVSVSEIDPICALQASMEGVDVITMEEALAEHEIFVTATGCRDVITLAHMRRMRHLSVVCNIGHFDHEIEMAGLEGLLAEGKAEKVEVKPQVHLWTFLESDHGPDGGPHSILVLSEGRLVNLGNATGHPSLVMSASFTNQVLAQIELQERAEGMGRGVSVLSKRLDEEVARLHLDRYGVSLTRLSPGQSSYLGIDPDGPYKPEHYRY